LATKELSQAEENFINEFKKLYVNHYLREVEKFSKKEISRIKRAEKLENDFSNMNLKKPSRNLINNWKSKGIDSCTSNQYQALLLSQNNKCAICKLSFDEAEQHLDHCHATGIIRGILCNNCNLGLGLFKDNIKSLEAAAAYLILIKTRGTPLRKIRWLD
jgi:Recombination endonuclease VII